MANIGNLIWCLTPIILCCISTTAVDANNTTNSASLFTVVSCKAQGTIYAIGNGTIKSVMVECDVNGTNELRAVQMGADQAINITDCPVNKPVKIFLFNTTHNETEGAVVKSPSLINETTVVCDGSNMVIEYNFTNSPFSPMDVTNVPLTNGLTITVTETDGEAPVTNVDIEHTYKLKITGPANMHILVESCDAASNSDFKEHHVVLYTDRKPNDDYGVLGNFSDNTTAGAVSEMNGFRLLDSPVVYLRCVVDVCNDVGCPTLTTTKLTTTTKPTIATDSTTAPKQVSTNSTVNDGRRKRRNVDIINRRVTLSTSFRVKRFYTTSGTNGKTSGAELYVVILSLLMAKLLFHRQ